MRILTRYILGEVVSHALIGAGVFTFVLFTRDLGRILELVVRNSAPLPSIAEIFFFTVPVALTYTIPMGVLVGILIGLSRLAADSEITAMRASGLGVWTFLRVISFFVIAAWLLALGNSVYLAPRSLAALARLQENLKSAQVSFEVQPRVFYEGFPKIVLYVQDVKAMSGGALWKGVFLADLTDPSAPRVSLAREGLLVSQGPDTLDLHLTKGSTHESDPKNPDQYQISSFQTTDIPIRVPAAQNNQEREPTTLAETKFTDLGRIAQTADPVTRRWDLIEYHRRLALPTACIVLALVGIPLGLSSKKGGKSGGFVLAILFFFLYYSIFLIGVSFARQGRISPAAGVWLANFLFFAGGVLLLWQSERRPIDFAIVRTWLGSLWLKARDAGFRTLRSGGAASPLLNRNDEASRAPSRESSIARQAGRWRLFNLHFPTIIDDYVLRGFAFYLALIAGSFVALLLVFTLFELLSDILRNQVSPLIVGEYLLNVTPYFLYYPIAPLSMLLAVLVTFGLLQRTNEITAIKATGISLYRVIVPVLVTSTLLAGVLFLSDQFYLPYTNKRQDALRNRIKGKPAQTYLRPDRKWIFGQHSDIYYYQFFDPDRDVFGGVSVFQFDPHTFQITHRITADRAHWSMGRWVYEQGWERSLNGSAIENYRKFDVATYPELAEAPGYFKKEVKQSSEMSYEELRRYIHDLEQSGFDVVRLRVQLQKKIAYPLITLVMAGLAIPFALTAGKRSALTGVATAIGIGVVYWTISGLFEAMGNLSQLPPAVAAWSPDLLFGFIGGYLILRMPT